LRSSILYTDVSRVVRALGMQSPENLTAIATVGAITITLNKVGPDWQVGMNLIIDANNPTSFETVTITAINGLVLSITALVNSHVINAPVINITQLNDFIAPASRWFDSVCNTPAGFGYESVTETKEAVINSNGYISVPLSKPTVVIADISSAMFQQTPMDTVDAMILSQGWIIDDFFFDVMPSNNYTVKRGMMTVTYMGGFNPIPQDIVQAVTVMAARFYKEKDSGYSDVIGTVDGGIMTYKKAMPSDVNAVVTAYTRWVE